MLQMRDAFKDIIDQNRGGDEEIQGSKKSQKVELPWYLKGSLVLNPESWFTHSAILVILVLYFLSFYVVTFLWGFGWETDPLVVKLNYVLQIVMLIDIIMIFITAIPRVEEQLPPWAIEELAYIK